jgi:hypothetical protein
MEMLLSALLAEFIGFAPVMKQRFISTMEKSIQSDDEPARRIMDAAIRFLDSIGPQVH